MKTPDLHDTITILGVLACILLLLSSCKGASIQIVPMPYTDTPPQQCSTQCPLSVSAQGAIREPWSARAPIGGLAQGAPANCVGPGLRGLRLRTHSYSSRLFRKLFHFLKRAESQKSSGEIFKNFSRG